MSTFILATNILKAQKILILLANLHICGI